MDEINVSDQARYIVAYLLHDAEANIEGQISDFDPAGLQEAESAGLVILAEYNDGTRQIVKAKDVRKPEPKLNGVTLVQPAYVDDRMVAVVDVFDALAMELASPQPMALMSLDAESHTAATMSSSSFQAALERLKVIVNGDV